MPGRTPTLASRRCDHGVCLLGTRSVAPKTEWARLAHYPNRASASALPHWSWSVNLCLGTEVIPQGDAAWKLHTRDWERSNDYVSKGIDANYADPGRLSVAEWVLYCQVWQAIIQGKMMEALRFQKHDPKDDCQGALIWSYTDCVGETGWAIIDYSLRHKAAYYWFRRAATPVKVIVRQRNSQCLTRSAAEYFGRIGDRIGKVLGEVALCRVSRNSLCIRE